MLVGKGSKSHEAVESGAEKRKTPPYPSANVKRKIKQKKEVKRKKKHAKDRCYLYVHPKT